MAPFDSTPLHLCRVTGAVLFLALGTVTIYLDRATQRINKEFMALSAALLILLISIGAGGAALYGLALQSALYCFVAMILWYLKIWPAGDAKLFILLGMFVNLFLAPSAQTLVRLTFSHLVNVFIPALLMVLPQCLRLFYRDVVASFRQADMPRNFSRFCGAMLLHGERTSGAFWGVGLMVLIYGMALLWYRWVFFTFGGLVMFPFVLAFWALSQAARRLLGSGPHRGIKAALALSVVYAVVLFQFRGQKIQPFLMNAAMMLLFCSFFNRLVSALGDYLNQTEILSIPIGHLRPSLVLADCMVKKLQQWPLFNTDTFGRLHPDGLSQRQVRLVRIWCRESQMNAIEIYRTHAFALWLFIGTLITILARRDLISLLGRMRHGN